MEKSVSIEMTGCLVWLPLEAVQTVCPRSHRNPVAVGDGSGPYRSPVAVGGRRLPSCALSWPFQRDLHCGGLFCSTSSKKVWLVARGLTSQLIVDYEQFLSWELKNCFKHFFLPKRCKEKNCQTNSFCNSFSKKELTTPRKTNCS